MIWESSSGWSLTGTSGNRRTTVGATLGETASNAASAGLGGLVLVLIFMVFYYRLPD